MRKPQPGDRAWCYYRNLVHTVYREIRHAGGPSDLDAKLRVPDKEFAAAMVSVREWRDTLKGTWLFERIRDEQTTTAIRRPYEEVTRIGATSRRFTVSSLPITPNHAHLTGGRVDDCAGEAHSEARSTPKTRAQLSHQAAGYFVGRLGACPHRLTRQKGS